MLLFYLSILDTAEEKSKFEALYLEYKALMFRVAFKILNNPQDAEDAVHQAFLKIIDHFQKIKQIKCPQTRAFVVTIVERKAIDIYRTKKRRDTIPLDEEYINTPSRDMLEACAEASYLAKEIASLPTKYRQLLLLKYDMGYSDQEIADLLSMKKETVKKTIQRAKVKLAEALKAESLERV